MHLARKYAFKDLLEGIEQECQKGNIGWQPHPNYPHLRVYNYSNSCTFDKAWTDFSRISRGLILDIKNQKIIATPFPKFWNYQEVISEIPNEPFETFEKLDGSLGIIYWYDNKWMVATRGSFNSDQAKWAQKFIDNSFDKSILIPTHTYLVEIIFKENRIVVNYPFEDLIFLGAYNDLGEEYTTDSLKYIANKTLTGCIVRAERIAKSYNHSKIEDLLEIAKTLPSNDEGFVVRFERGLRVKIKGDEYCRIHRLISNCTPLAVWDSFRKMDDLGVIKKQLPEEFQIDMDNIYKILKEYFITYEAELEGLVNYYKNYTDKELGLEKECPAGFLECVKRFVFPSRKTGFLANINEPGSDRDKFFNLFRPTSNKLDGYTPSTSINRFNNESS